MYYAKHLLIIMSIALSSACKKDAAVAKPTPPPPDKTVDILESGDWKLTAFTISPALNGVTDVMANIPPCAKDNLLQFKANGIFYFDDGATKCDAAAPQKQEGTWSYDSTIKELRYNAPGLDFIIDIKAINSTSLSGTRNVVMNGNTYLYSGTLTKQ